MHPRLFARHTPDRNALLMATSGASTSYAELEKIANRETNSSDRSALRPAIRSRSG